jgi:predicted component of type VI protein secretion system
MLIHIKVKDSRSRCEREHTFTQLPIRIGRNPLNDLIIEDGFVSQWHGILRREDQHLVYMDLGSTNGSSLDGKRLPKDVAVPLPDGARLGVACFQLSPVVEDIPDTELDGATQVIRRVPSPSTPRPADPLAKTACADSAQIARCLRLLQGFSDAFVALRNGHQEFGEQVGVRPITGSTLLHRARTGGEVADHLLDGSRSVDACLAELKAVFADMGIHQIAFMEGMNQSVRSLLESLEGDAQAAASGFLARMFGKSKSFGQRLATLICEDEALHAELFGEAFARAYASVALGSGQG